jgi:hypothetical protein
MISYLENEFKGPREEFARIAMHGRLLRCPAGGNPSDCPLFEIRQLSIEARIKWLNSQSDDDVLDMFLNHVRCADEKLGAEVVD